MAIFTSEESKSILKKVLGFSKADTCEANLRGTDGGNIRYARNTVSTAGENSDVILQVKCGFGNKSGVATVNEFDDASLEKVVRRAEELAQLAPENPEFMSPLARQDYSASKTFVDATAKITPDYRAQAAANSIQPAKTSDTTAAGFLENKHAFVAMMNTNGLFAYNKATGVDFTVTMRTNDGTGSGWATRNFNDVDKLDTAEASKVAIDKALQSRNSKAIEPGKYTVILEPAASADLIRNMLINMSARTADEGRSFMSKKGGGTKLGEKIVDERINMFVDPSHSEVPSTPFDQDGQARKKLDLIRNGVVTNLFYDRYWASQKNVASVPTPGNAIIDGGDASLEDLIKDTRRGVLVTRFWYIRTVDPQTLLYTGLTRDGTFYIENGKIKHPIKNFRFNESPVIMLNNLETLGKQTRVDVGGGGGGGFFGFGEGVSLWLPYMKIRDFTFTSLSDAV
jgi:predicted Zn-dependent protease